MTETKEEEWDWNDEAKAVMRDVKQHVYLIFTSNLPSSAKRIFFNLTTLEMKDFCVELTPQGFRVVGEKYDSNDLEGKYPIYETPYSMLDNLTSSYRDSFGEQLVQKLNKLKEDQTRKEKEDSEG